MSGLVHTGIYVAQTGSPGFVLMTIAMLSFLAILWVFLVLLVSKSPHNPNSGCPTEEELEDWSMMDIKYLESEEAFGAPAPSNREVIEAMGDQQLAMHSGTTNGDTEFARSVQRKFDAKWDEFERSGGPKLERLKRDPRQVATSILFVSPGHLTSPSPSHPLPPQPFIPPANALGGHSKKRIAQLTSSYSNSATVSYLITPHPVDQD